jgi:hypothetical protein
MKAIDNKELALSFSRLQMYDWCPQQFRYKVLIGMKEPPAPAMERGNEIHKMLERFVVAKGKVSGKLPKEFEHLKPELTSYRKQNPSAEAQYAFTRDWKLTGYFDKNVAWRMKIDLRTEPEEGVVRLTDYKSGKVKPEEHREQLELYILTEMLVNGFPKRMEAAMFYIDHLDEPQVLIVHENPTQKDLARYKKQWEAKANRIRRDTKLIPTPSEFKCGRCHFSSKKGGPCKAAAA